MMAMKKRGKPGPEAQRLKGHGDWKEAVGRAVRLERPAEGWPKPDNPKTRRKARRAGSTLKS
jgi:hypothetical protein